MDEENGRPEPTISAKQYWGDMKARWKIHRYEWHEASGELKELAQNVNQSEWFNTLKKFTVNSYHIIKAKVEEVADLESTPAGEKVEETPPSESSQEAE